MAQSMTVEEKMEWQRAELRKLPHAWAVKNVSGVKGDFTSGDYATWQLNRIIGPDKWSFELQRFEIEERSPKLAYVRAIGRLTITFADGSGSVREDIGIWPVRIPKNGTTLDDVSADTWETAEKATKTDCFKACAEQFGTCFRPLADQDLKKAIERRAKKEAEKAEGSDPGDSVPDTNVGSDANEPMLGL